MLDFLSLSDFIVDLTTYWLSELRQCALVLDYGTHTYLSPHGEINLIDNILLHNVVIDVEIGFIKAVRNYVKENTFSVEKAKRRNGFVKGNIV